MINHSTLGKVEIVGWLKTNPRERTIKLLDDRENTIAVIERKAIDDMLSALESQQTAAILRQLEAEG